jgi:hypothetical protein
MWRTPGDLKEVKIDEIISVGTPIKATGDWFDDPGVTQSVEAVPGQSGSQSLLVGER